MDQPIPPIPWITNVPTVQEVIDNAAEKTLSWPWLVEDFQRIRLHNDLPLYPELPDDENLLNTCVGFLQEEIAEMKLAVEEEDLPGIIDGITDLIYYSIGMALQLGVNLEPHFREVHMTNMAKVHNPDAVPGKEKRVTKPEGWMSPRIREILDAQWMA